MSQVDFWSISKQKFAISNSTLEQDLAEGHSAFQAFRKVLSMWKERGKLASVALGGDSACGEWSVVFEDGLWAVFVAERGMRYTPCFFFSAWDAVNYVGFRLATDKSINEKFDPLMPNLK